MTNPTNHQWRLATRPTGMIEERNFRWTEDPVPDVGDGQILVRNLYLSCDPTQRGWLARDTYMPAVAVGDVVRSFAVGRVEKSTTAAFREGDLVQGLFGWQEYALVRTDGPSRPQKLLAGVPIELQMSAVGVTGLTAYFGLLDVGRPQPGETVVVSAAAGATGSVAGQMARIKGCRAIGIAGGQDKCRWLVDVARLDAAIDYKSNDVAAKLREACPKGIDVYFDNVGGELLDLALAQLAMRARVVICGAIAAYNDLVDAGPRPGPKNYMMLLIKRARMEGFVVSDYFDRAPDAAKQLLGWVQENKIVDRVDVLQGLENAPRALRRLFLGENQGKQLVKIAET